MTLYHSDAPCGLLEIPGHPQSGIVLVHDTTGHSVQTSYEVLTATGRWCRPGELAAGEVWHWPTREAAKAALDEWRKRP